MSDPSWLTSHEQAPTSPITTTIPTNATTTTSTATSNGNGNSSPTFKVILIGEAGVGKTSLFSRVRHPQPLHHDLSASFSTAATVGVDTHTRTISTRHGIVKLTLWDTAGVERYRTLTRNYYRNTNAALLVFSLDDASTLYPLSRWQHDVNDTAPNAISFLVGNKSDLTRGVSDETLNSFAEGNNCLAAFLTSAKTGEGVEEALTSVCEHLVHKFKHRTEMHDRDKLWLEGSGINVHGSGEHEAKKCC
ncbi:ras-related protein Rab-25-like [Littorina saxatilis]|uniref:Uncharacterized protein n=1 Tax=Littorina saxatilis TaxID=31220 RepID=A0AAN9GP57_9CAEN